MDIQRAAGLFQAFAEFTPNPALWPLCGGFCRGVKTFIRTFKCNYEKIKFYSLVSLLCCCTCLIPYFSRVVQNLWQEGDVHAFYSPNTTTTGPDAPGVLRTSWGCCMSCHFRKKKLTGRAVLERFNTTHLAAQRTERFWFLAEDGYPALSNSTFTRVFPVRKQLTVVRPGHINSVLTCFLFLDIHLKYQ